MLWAQLLARIYEVLPLLCPVCKGEMRIISFITQPSTVERILLHLDLPHEPPRLCAARGPPHALYPTGTKPAVVKCRSSVSASVMPRSVMTAKLTASAREKSWSS